MQYRKVIFGQTEMEYLGFWVTLTEIRPLNTKVEAIVNMKPPKKTKEVRVFVVIVNCYRYMWSKRSHLLHTLTSLMSQKVKFKLTDVENKLFDDIKCVVSQDKLLLYLYFNKRFDIHTYARN